MPAKCFFRYVVVLLFVNLVFVASGQAQIIPNNEKFVVGALETINRAQATFFSTAGSNTRYGTLSELQPYIDPALASGQKYGYVFLMTVVPFSPPNQPARFQVSAVPQRYGKGGKRSFYIDESGGIRSADRGGAPADADDPLFQLPCGENGAIVSMRTYNSAQATYQATGGFGNYGTFGQLSEIGLLSVYLVDGDNCGYVFTVETTPASQNVPASFRIRGVPRQYQVTGIRSFYIDETGVVRGADRAGAQATVTDPPIEN